MGDVWEATHSVTGRSVAIKCLRTPRNADPTSAGRARFMLEAQAACAVEHPNVVEILDFVDAGDEPPIMVMELLRGETLAAKLEREQALSTAETLRWLVPVVSAVGTAHARGIVHRDLKPANIFLHRNRDTEVVKVLDFGIAKWLSPRPSDASLRTETGSTLGTPCYMAPEQAMGERVIDHRADIWALGVILYECLAGMRPVDGENAASIMVRLMSTGIMPIERLVTNLPPELSKLVASMLGREAARRPKSLKEVASVLGSLTAERAPEFGEPEVQPAPSGTTTGERGSSAPQVAWGEATAGDERPAPAAFRARRLAIGAAFLLAAAATASWALSEGPVASPVASSAPKAPANGAAALAIPEAPAVKAPERPSDVPTAITVGTSSTPRLKGSSGRLVAPVPRVSSPARESGLPPGAACARSRDCASRLCLALTCE